MVMRFERTSDGGNLPLFEGAEQPAFSWHPPMPAQNGPALELPGSMEEALTQGTALLSTQAQLAETKLRLELQRALRRKRKRLQSRAAAIAADAARADQVEPLRTRAGQLLSALHSLAPNAQSVSVLDYQTQPPTEVTLEIDPRLGPKLQADAWFAQARRFERGARIAAERAQLTQRELTRLDDQLQRVERADSDELSALAAEMRDAGLLSASPSPQAARPSERKRLPYREFRSAAGRRILVGRGAEDNDELTLHHARPHDLWLHARDCAGSHVIVPLDRSEACPQQLLCDAATLAAHFSKASGEHSVDVIHTAKRYVRKPRKAGRGLVLVEREKVFRLDLEPDRLRRLLASEIRRQA